MPTARSSCSSTSASWRRARASATASRSSRSRALPAGLEQLGEERPARCWSIRPSTSVGVTRAARAPPARGVIEGDEPCVLAKACKNPIELDGRARTPSGATAPRCAASSAGSRREVGAPPGHRAARPPTGSTRERAARPAVSRPELRDDLGGRPEQPRSPHYRVTRREQPRARGGLALSGRFRRPVPRRDHRHHAHDRDRRAERRDATALHAGAQGPHRDRARAVPARHQRRPARRLRAAAALAGRARLRPRHRPWHRQLSVRPRGAGRGSPRRRHGRAQARHDPLQRARLLQEPAPTASGSRTWWW